MSGRRLKPMIDWIGSTPIHHGERGDLDPRHPEACLCGNPFYLECDGPGIESMTICLDSDGHIEVAP